MAEEITVGTVLGGRYLVTSAVVATAEGDLVFDGTDQVLNRPVSILMAAPSNATRVAVSAREIAMGTRPSDVQVLDLGLHASSTYLITNTIDAANLLDLVVEVDAPYIEPFQTDTLGQEIFGEVRALEPQVYDDDAEYYQELAEEQQRKPLFGGRFGRKNKNQQAQEIPPAVPLTGAGVSEPVTGPFAAEPMSASEAAAAYPSTDAPEAASSPTTAPSPTRPAGAPTLGAAAPQAPQQAPQEAPSPQGSGSATSPTAPEHPADDETRLVARQAPATPAVTQLPPVQAPHEGQLPPVSGHGAPQALRSDADVARDAATRGETGRPASRFPREAASATSPAAAAGGSAGLAGAGAAAVAGGAADSSGAGAPLSSAAQRTAFDQALAQSPQTVQPAPRQTEEPGNKLTRAIVGLLLVAVLVVGVVIAVQFLSRPGDTTPVASSSAPAPSTSEGSGPATSEPSETPQRVKPKISGISLAYPADPAKVYNSASQSMDSAIDGKDSTSFAMWSYPQPNFGGVTTHVTYTIELKKKSDISAVKLTGMTASGGSVQISVGDTTDPEAAKDIFSGSFSAPTQTVDTGSSEPVQGKYVFITITKMPVQANPNSSNLPYGFRVSEIKVS